jgi:ribulose kinase
MEGKEGKHYIGIDVGTGSARACLIDDSGEILSVATEPIKLWQPQTGYYVRASYNPIGVNFNHVRNNPRLIFGEPYASASKVASRRAM